ncbi:hypothetical protein [uncultured Arsenicicoccus sp.]|uniref:hypothetical protein n=1 Tax=uncultured Arsenicicoccus sp. TaxID=491339 RepID=UPI0025984443|nr:hypothetical protein [uncultured Arsenicicoccus sp.]
MTVSGEPGRAASAPITTPGGGPYEPVDNLVVYDVVWLIVAIALIVVGTWLWRSGSRGRGAARA